MIEPIADAGVALLPAILAADVPRLALEPPLFLPHPALGAERLALYPPVLPFRTPLLTTEVALLAALRTPLLPVEPLLLAPFRTPFLTMLDALLMPLSAPLLAVLHAFLAAFGAALVASAPAFLSPRLMTAAVAATAAALAACFVAAPVAVALRLMAAAVTAAAPAASAPVALRIREGRKGCRQHRGACKQQDLTHRKQLLAWKATDWPIRGFQKQAESSATSGEGDRYASMTTLPAPRPGRLTLLIGAAFLLTAPPAAAQEREEDRRDRIVTIGLGADLTPRFPGSNDLSIGPFPDFGIRREGEEPEFEAGDESAGFGLLNIGGFSIGPAITFINSRRNQDVGAPVGEVGWTLEVGAFAQAFLTEHLRLRAEARRGINGHESWNGDLSADFVLHLAETSHLSIGPRLRIADDRFMDTYFGVTPAVATATGLTPYNPGGGIWSVGATASFDTMLSENWGIYGYARYDRLAGDAADSPIVRSFGSRNQFAAGVGVNYSFRIPSRR